MPMYIFHISTIDYKYVCIYVRLSNYILCVYNSDCMYSYIIYGGVVCMNIFVVKNVIVNCCRCQRCQRCCRCLVVTAAVHSEQQFTADIRERDALCLSVDMGLWKRDRWRCPKSLHVCPQRSSSTVSL